MRIYRELANREIHSSYEGILKTCESEVLCMRKRAALLSGEHSRTYLAS